MKGYVLENKLGISSSEELKRTEETLIKIKCIELWNSNILNENNLSGTFEQLVFIHNYLCVNRLD